MKTDQAIPGGDEQSGGAASGENTQKPTETAKPDVVTREAYERVLSEAKKAKDELKKREDAEKQSLAEAQKKHEEELVHANNYKTLWENERKRAEAAEKAALEKEQKLTGLSQERLNEKKFRAFMGLLPGKVDQEYWGLVDLDKIAVDPETGKIDEATLTGYAKEFETKHSRLIDRASKAKAPSTAAQGASALSYDEWLKLPLAEMKARQKDIK